MIEGFCEGRIPLVFPFRKDVQELLPRAFESHIVHAQTLQRNTPKVEELLASPELEMALRNSR